MKTFKNANGNPVLMKMVKAIHENKDYLGEVDGLIGDGDHGMNMNKGFMMFGDEFGGPYLRHYFYGCCRAGNGTG